MSCNLFLFPLNFLLVFIGYQLVYDQSYFINCSPLFTDENKMRKHQNNVSVFLHREAQTERFSRFSISHSVLMLWLSSGTKKHC